MSFSPAQRSVAGRGRCHSGSTGPGETHRDAAGGDQLPEEGPRRGFCLRLHVLTPSYQEKPVVRLMGTMAGSNSG